jgi:glutamate dehydrogenase
MHSKLDEAKDELLIEAAAMAEHRRGEEGELTTDEALFLLRKYYEHVAPDDVLERRPVDVYGAAISHYRLAGARPQGTSSVRAYTPTVEANEWTAGGHTVVEIVTDDMPFLVDSISMILNEDNHSLHTVVHPQMLVRRDITGRLLEVCSTEPFADQPAPDAVRESWMHVEIDRVPSTAELATIEQKITSVLRDVREAVEDWRKMHAQALSIAKELAQSPPPLPDKEIDEGRALLEWLADDHFTFLGYREYELSEVAGDDVLRAVPGTGLGILRSDQDMSPSFGKLPPAVRAKAREKTLLVITKANSRATVHRPVYLDYIGVKVFDANGEVSGERRILGLFSSTAYNESIMRVPVLREKASQLLDSAGFSPRSHSGKALLDILEDYPRDELFQTPVDELLRIAETVLHLRERRQLRFFTRRDIYGRFLSCLVFLPRDRYTTPVRERMQNILKATLGAETIDYTARVSESVLARLHFVVRADPGQTLREFDETALEVELAEATRSWNDDFADALREQFGEDAGTALVRKYDTAFPEAYKEDFPAAVAAADVRRLESLDDGSIELSLYYPVGAPPSEARFKVFRRGHTMSLSAVLPVLSSMGAEVVDERPYQLEIGQEPAWVYDFGLRYSRPFPSGCRDLFQDAFTAVWDGRAESDGFSALVLSAQLPWRLVSILRAYAKYFRQGGSTFSQDYVEDCLLANVPIARMLVQLFEARFDPGGADGALADDGRRLREADIQTQIMSALDDVVSLDHDRILRSYLGIICATLRTNFYQRDSEGNPKPYLSLKLDPRQIPELPEPRPRFEIFVYAPRVEGVHLRFGPVARGGLRWSDRREDFRTEVLGLVKAQMVKNAVIVPVGSKGGFYCKNLPDAFVDREAWLTEGIACYKMFICGLLDVTDNLVAGEVIAPSRVVRHDGDDTYLVVAADKGTATFSDIANGVAGDYGYWLGDAFASGGSVGYDHKVMGITARGAWESVKRHFRERSVDCQSQDFTCVGIGDMSGDVFGNGMLLSEHIRLVAAFDHRDIFVDPAPDAATSYDERRRLFDLPRSSWADYNHDLISPGGGVFSRSLKAIPVSPEMANALGIDEKTESMTPAELMRAILLAPVDLLWNGGIGTYVKATSESHADAGDKSNDAIRVNGSELRVKSVGEGGNLGFTQLGRIEYATAGGRICTDFIDNSAGVDTSDHEVNIKILLDKVVEAGDLTSKQRNELLGSMTEEVGRLVLVDNYYQNVALACAQRVSLPLSHVHQAWIDRLEQRGLLDREIEFLPSGKELEERRANKQGLTTPELAVLLAYTKIVLADELLQGDLAEDPFLRSDLISYFPSKMRQQYRNQMLGHPLRREIIITQIVNGLVNFAGTTFYHRLSLETNATADELVLAHFVCREIYNANAILEAVDALDIAVDASIQTDMRLSVRTLIERATRWMVNNRRSPLDSEGTVDYFGTAVQQVVSALPEILVGTEQRELAARRDRFTAAGVSTELAVLIASLPPAYAALGIVEASRRDNRDPIEVARVHAILGDRLGVSRLLARIVALPREDRWQTMARASLRDDAHAVQAALTNQVMESTSDALSPQERVAAWEEADARVIGRAHTTLREITSDEDTDLARLSVGLRVVRTLLSS